PERLRAPGHRRSGLELRVTERRDFAPSSHGCPGFFPANRLRPHPASSSVPTTLVWHFVLFRILKSDRAESRIEYCAARVGNFQFPHVGTFGGPVNKGVAQEGSKFRHGAGTRSWASGAEVLCDAHSRGVAITRHILDAPNARR